MSVIDFRTRRAAILERQKQHRILTGLASGKYRPTEAEVLELFFVMALIWAATKSGFRWLERLAVWRLDCWSARIGERLRSLMQEENAQP